MQQLVPLDYYQTDEVLIIFSPPTKSKHVADGTLHLGSFMLHYSHLSCPSNTFCNQMPSAFHTKIKFC